MAGVNVYGYLSATQFLNAWLVDRQATRQDFSMRKWAKEIQVTPAYLSLILNSHRPLRRQVLEKMMATMKLADHERHYLVKISAYETESSGLIREQMLEEIANLKRFKSNRAVDFKLGTYLSNPIYVFLREAAVLDGFRNEPGWIQKLFWFKHSKEEIRNALRFLIEGRFLRVGENGRLQSAEVSLNCSAEVLRTSMSRFHRKMFSIASEAIQQVPREKRNVLGLTTPVSVAQFEEIKKILDETLKKIDEVTRRPDRKTRICYVGLQAITLADEDVHNQNQSISI